jgi:hypothetical protein
MRRLRVARGIDRPIFERVISRPKRQRQWLGIVRVWRPVFPIVEAILDPLNRAQPVCGGEGDRHRPGIRFAALAVPDGRLRDLQVRARGRLVDREDDLLRQIWRALPFVPDLNGGDVNAFAGNLRAVFDARFDIIAGCRTLDRKLERLRIVIGRSIRRRRQFHMLNR